MKLVGELKKLVEETKNKEEAKELIENAGMLLTDEELDLVAGGIELNGGCPKGGNHNWTSKFDSVANKQINYCSKCGASLEIGVTSI